MIGIEEARRLATAAKAMPEHMVKIDKLIKSSILPGYIKAIRYDMPCGPSGYELAELIAAHYREGGWHVDIGTGDSRRGEPEPVWLMLRDPQSARPEPIRCAPPFDPSKVAKCGAV